MNYWRVEDRYKSSYRCDRRLIIKCPLNSCKHSHYPLSLPISAEHLEILYLHLYLHLYFFFVFSTIWNPQNALKGIPILWTLIITQFEFFDRMPFLIHDKAAAEGSLCSCVGVSIVIPSIPAPFARRLRLQPRVS